ncbi:MAG TPA: O-antigen ligase family protein [Thermoleophilaceae bacterium]
MTGVRLPGIAMPPIGWVLGAILASLAGGLLVGISDMAALDVAIVLAATIVVFARPYGVLVATVLVLAALPTREWIPFLLLFAGGLALLALAPAVPGRRVTVPMLLLLALAVPSLSILPSPDEGIIADPYLHLPLLGTNYARFPSVELREWLALGSVLVLFCLAALCVRGRHRLETVVTAIVVSAVVPIGIGLKQIVTGDTYERAGTTLRSVRGTFPHPNYFAFYLVVVLAIAIAMFLDSRRLWARIGLGALLIAGVVCLFLTYTRSAWIGFALTLLVMGVLRYRRLLVVAVVGLAVAALAAPGAAREAQQRFGDLASQSAANDTNSWQWRIDEWSALLPYGSDKPLTGQGWDSYTRLTVRRFGHSDKRYPTVRYPAYGVYSALGFTAHNDYVKSFVELGVPGLVLWVLTLLALPFTAWRARRVPGLGGIPSTAVAISVGLIVIGASDNLQGYTAVLTYQFVLCGALAGVTAAARGRRAAPATSRVSQAAAADRADEAYVETLPELQRAEPELEQAREPERRPPPAVGLLDRARGVLRRRRGSR